jgi:hypothetical protein
MTESAMEANKPVHSETATETHAEYMARKLSEAKAAKAKSDKAISEKAIRPKPGTPEHLAWRIEKLKDKCNDPSLHAVIDDRISEAYQFPRKHIDGVASLSVAQNRALIGIIWSIQDQVLQEIAQAKRDALYAKQIALEEKKSAAWAALPEKKKQQILAREAELRKVESEGAQVTTGNLLEWTAGNSEAAYTSRYQQACRLKIKKLTELELSEVESVIVQALRVIRQEKKVVRLEVVLLETRQQRERLRVAIESAEQAAIEAQANLPQIEGADNALAASLAAAIEDARNRTGGYVYLKQWTLADGTRWLKLGITNNPSRRDAEQNVLPVPAVTLRLMETQSMDQAAAIERALHQQLAAQKVTGAGNRELFHLDDGQLAALMAAMDS